MEGKKDGATGSGRKSAGAEKKASAKSHNKELGKRGEDAAARFLERRGYMILERNWTCSFGEADIVCRTDTALVFVEVKTRTGEYSGMPEEAVGPEKRKRYENIALSFLRTYNDYQDMIVRFDVVAIVVVAPDRAMIRHHINAWGVA